MLRYSIISRALRPHGTRTERIESLAHDIFGKGNQFLKNVYSLEALPEGGQSFPEIAFIGTPSTGKSMLISNLTHNQRLGKAGVTRGKTKGLTFFDVGNAIALVDTPGYGSWKHFKVARQADQSQAVGILLQYLAMRKKKNLKHVYWCFSGQPNGRTFGANARHTELLTFLLYEKIPFTPIITKCDYYNGRPADLIHDTELLRDFLGNEKMPIIQVGANITKMGHITGSFGFDHLMCDLVSHVCEGVADDDLTYKNIHDMGFIPYSSEEQLRIERLYPKERVALPDRDMLTMAKWVDQHENAKFAYAESKRFQELTSMARIEAALQMPMVNYKNSKTALQRQEEVMQLITGEVQSDRNAINVHSHSILQVDSHDKESSQLLGITDGSEEGPSGGHSGSSLIDAELNPSDLMNISSDVPEASNNSTDAASAFPLPPPRVQLTPYQQSIVASGISPAFPCILVPDSLLVSSLSDHIAKFDNRSIQAFEKQQEANTLEAKYEEVGIFVEAGAVDRSDPNAEHHPEIPYRRTIGQKETLHYKYMQTIPERKTSLNSDKAMCPWLGAEKEGRVIGLDVPAVAKGGTLMRGVKDRGFGGNSYSVHTFKKRNYMKPKAGRWAR